MSDTNTNDPAEMTEEKLEIKDLKMRIEELEAELKREKHACDIYEQFPRLYNDYKQRTDDEIREKLESIDIVIQKHDGIGTEFGYYKFTKEHMDKVKAKPRNIPMFYYKDKDEDEVGVGSEMVKGLVEYKTYYYLVKSTSHFFLKDDVGELLDQIGFRDWYSVGGEIKAICIEEGYTKVPGVIEHFLKRATLLVPEGSPMLDRLKK